MHEDAPPYRASSSPSPGCVTLSPTDGERDRERGAFKFIDLFCGIGSFRLAFERVGGVCVFVLRLERAGPTLFFQPRISTDGHE
ncbi:MAG: DNA cytosine methyltransferase [Verrucomicrobia bacterium]|nr:DNA cytosine methyltransferase [Verrucomicrobiota bacterium]